MAATPAAAQAALIPERYGRSFRPMPDLDPKLALVPKEGEPVEGAHFRVPGRLAADRVLEAHERAELLTTYIAALECTTDAEWRYRMAEGEYHADGARHFARMWAMQVIVDPTGEIWMQYAPLGFDIPLPIVRRSA